MSAILCDSTVVVVRTRSRAMPLAMIIIRKSIHGFLLFPIWLWGSLGGPLGHRSELKRELKCSAHSKAVLDDSWITEDPTLLYQHKLYYCTIAVICHIVKMNSTSCVIQSPDQDLAKQRSAFGHQQN